MTIHIISASDFINRLTQRKLSAKQINRAVAYLRGKGIAFYDNWSQEHCIIHHNLSIKKNEILNALRYTL